MTNSDTIQLKINEAKTFMVGQIELYKLQFVETHDSKYLEVMNDLNKTLQLIIFLEKNSIEISKQLKKD